MNDILKNVRKENLKDFLVTLFWGICSTGMGIMFLFGILTEEISLWGIIACLLFLPFGILIDYKAIELLKIVINPSSSSIFKKYGDESKIQEILNDINNNIEYQDRRIILSKKYIMEKGNVESIIPYENVLGVYKSIHKTNFVVDYYKVVITDKFDDSVYIKYPRDEGNIIDEVISFLALRCKNAKFGYSNETFKHINENKQDLKTYTSDKNTFHNMNNENNLKEDKIERKTDTLINNREDNDKNHCTICSICNKENHNVEGDFCVFCGSKLTNKPDIIEPKNKKIDKSSNKNLNHKSNNNHGNDNFFFITTIILIIILILLGGFTAYYIISDKSPELEKEITSLKQKNTKLSNEKSSLEQTNRKNASKIDFFDKNVVFVLEGYGNFYYTYDQMLQVTQGKSSYSYWAYNIEQAIDLGYKPLQ